MPDCYDLHCRHKPRVDERETLGSVLVGARFRYGRQQAGLSQRKVAALAGVSQSLISRFERGRCPGLAAWRLVAIAMSIDPRFPFGCGPHDHECKWPYNPATQRSWFDILNR
jgi:transcriptional regulator with XRE-family HTH domain